MKAVDHNSETGGSIASIPPHLMGQIIATASDIALILSADEVIRSVLVNPHHRSFGSLNQWEGLPLRQVLTVESVAKFGARLQELIAQGGTRGQGHAIRAVDGAHSRSLSTGPG